MNSNVGEQEQTEQVEVYIDFNDLISCELKVTIFIFGLGDNDVP